MIKKNHLITLLAIPMMAGYAFLVSAAAPSGGYTPGATLDPDCAPGDADCIVIAGGSSQWTDVAAGTDLIQVSGSGLDDVTSSGDYNYLGQFGVFVVGNAGDTMLAIENRTNGFANGQIITGGTSGAAGTVRFFTEIPEAYVFLENVTGTFVPGEVISNFDNGGTADVLSATVTTADSFIWQEQDIPEVGILEMTGSAQTLFDSFSVTWGSTSGHTVGDQWVLIITQSGIAYDSGAVGIGTMAPAYDLQVVGNFYAEFDDSLSTFVARLYSTTEDGSGIQRGETDGNIGSFTLGDDGGLNYAKYSSGFSSTPDLLFRLGDGSDWSGSSEENKFFFDNGINSGNPSIRLGSVDNNNWDLSNRGDRSIAIGFAIPAFSIPAPMADGLGSIALGSGATASGIGSFASGIYSLASGPNSIAFGNNVTASGEYAVVLGNSATAGGDRSFAVGPDTIAPSFSEAVLGSGSTTYVPVSSTSFDLADRIFTVGNGEFGVSQSDAFTILKSGQIGIGIDNFETTTNDELLQIGGTFLSNTEDFKMGNTFNYGGMGYVGSGSWYRDGGTILYNGAQDRIGPAGVGAGGINAGFGVANFSQDIFISSYAEGSTGVTSIYTDQVNDIQNEIFVGSGVVSLSAGNVDGTTYNSFGIIGSGFMFSSSVGGQIADIQPNGDFTLNAYQNCTGFTSTAGGLLQCTASDARLKNIQGDFTSGLDALRILSPQLYTWKDGEYYMSGEYAGFIAQNVEEALPIAVTTDRNGYLNIQDRPILAAAVNAIKELDLSIQDIENVSADDSTFGGMMREWFANTANGINDFVATTIRGKTVETSKLCVDDICVTRDQFLNIVNQSNQIPYAPEPGPINTPAQEPGNETPLDESIITPDPVPEEVAIEPEPIVIEEQASVETPSETVSE